MANPDGKLPTKRQTCTVSISTEATGLSDAINFGGGTISSIAMSTGWTDASLTFQGSLDGTNYYDVYTSTGGEVSYSTTASRALVFDPIFWAAFSSIKVRSGTAAIPVAQAAARTLTIGLQALGVVK